VYKALTNNLKEFSTRSTKKKNFHTSIYNNAQGRKRGSRRNKVPGGFDGFCPEEVLDLLIFFNLRFHQKNGVSKGRRRRESTM
jgi:hypothetical protein